MAPYLENLDMNQVNYGIASGTRPSRPIQLGALKWASPNIPIR